MRAASAVTIGVDVGGTKSRAAAVPGIRPPGALGNQAGAIGVAALARDVPAMMGA